MDPSSRLISTSAKAGLLATSLYLGYFIIRENVGIVEIFYMSFILFITTSTLSLFFIVGSILPIVSLDKQRSLDIYYKRYFPYYAMLFFLGITTISIFTEFNEFVVVISLIAFVTASQSWIWLFKD